MKNLQTTLLPPPKFSLSQARIGQLVPVRPRCGGWKWHLKADDADKGYTRQAKGKGVAVLNYKPIKVLQLSTGTIYPCFARHVRLLLPTIIKTGGDDL